MKKKKTEAERQETVIGSRLQRKEASGSSDSFPSTADSQWKAGR